MLISIASWQPRISGPIWCILKCRIHSQDYNPAAPMANANGYPGTAIIIEGIAEVYDKGPVPRDCRRRNRKGKCFMRSRAGFTLIELMVAMALTVFIMVILSQAFILSLDTFSGMKGIGDMQQIFRHGGGGSA